MIGLRTGRLLLGMGTALGIFGLMTRNPWLWSAWPIACIAIAVMNEAVLRRRASGVEASGTTGRPGGDEARPFRSAADRS
mgnify:CR=1 FL=1